MSDAVRGRLGRNRVVFALALIALCAYLPGFRWGAPHATSAQRAQAWGVDDETPMGTLGQVHDIVRPRPDRNVGYPRMHPLMVTTAQAPYLVYLWLSGELAEVSAEFPFGLRSPVDSFRTLTHIAHLLSVLLGVGVVIAAFDAAATTWDAQTGVAGALLVMTAFPMFYYTRTGNVDIPVLFFVSLAIAGLARCLRFGLSPWRAAWLGAFAGFALATKESSFGALAPIPLVLFAHQWHRSNREPWPPLFWRSSVVGVAVSVICFGLGSGLFLSPAWYLRHLELLTGRVESLSAAEHSVAATHSYTWQGHSTMLAAELGHLAAAMTTPILVLGIVGLLVVVRREPSRSWLVWPAFGYLAFMFVVVRVTQLRYIMPLALVLALFAGRAFVLGWRSRATLVRVVATLSFVLGVGVSTLRGIELTWAMIHDSRYEAATLFADLAEGVRIDYFGASQKLPPLPAGVVTELATEYNGMHGTHRIDEAKADEIRRRWSERRPDFVVVIPDHTSAGRPHSFPLPPTLYEELIAGAGEYVPIARFQTPPLMPWLSMPELDYPSVNPPIQVFGPRRSVETSDRH